MEHIDREDLRRRVEAGDAQAMFELARWNIHGPFEERNPDEAFRLTQQAVEIGHTEAVSQLGSCYAHGIGVTHDLDKAIALYQQAVENDVADAMYLLGNAYYCGLCVPRDSKKAVALLKSAVERGHTPAKVLLACCYLSGEGIRKNKRKGRQLFKEAEATPDFPRTYVELGNAYFWGNGIKQDAAKALEWYQRAADGYVAGAWVQIAWFYLNGAVVCQDMNKAVEILKRPEIVGTAGAEWLLAYCHLNGSCVERNPDEAVRLYRSAAEKSSAGTQYEWGRILDEGIYANYGIPQDRVEADKWLNLAAKKDYVWTRKREIDWRLTTWAAFCLYWWIIPCFAVISLISPLISSNGWGIKSPKDAFFLVELCGYLLPCFLLYFAGAFGNLRCARWGSVWMFFASLDMAILGGWILYQTGWELRVVIAYGIFVGLLVLSSRVLCLKLAERTRWRERKWNERRITFKPTIVLAATVFCLMQVLRFVLGMV